MRAVMNEQLRKLLGINIAYGGDGEAAAADAADDAGVADLAADDVTDAQTEFGIAETDLAQSTLQSTETPLSQAETLDAMSHSTGPTVAGQNAAATVVSGTFSINTDGTISVTNGTVVGVANGQGTAFTVTGPDIATINTDGTVSIGRNL
jgi:hypothetical protein